MTYYMVETKNTHIPMWFDFMQGTWVANCLATKFADRESAERMAATLYPRDYIITEHMSGDVLQIPPESDWVVNSESVDSEDMRGLAIYAFPTKNSRADQIKFIKSEDGVALKLIAYVHRLKPSWEPKDTDLIVEFEDGNHMYIPTACRFEHRKLLGHYAKVEDVSDIGKSVDWFKANRPWK